LLYVPLHGADSGIHHLLVVFPFLSVEMGGTGFLLHPPVRQLGEVDGETSSSGSLLTQTFQRDESGNVEADLPPKPKVLEATGFSVA